MPDWMRRKIYTGCIFNPDPKLLILPMTVVAVQRQDVHLEYRTVWSAGTF